MKKGLCILTAAILIVSMLAGCQSKTTAETTAAETTAAETTAAETTAAETTAAETTAPAEDGWKIGIGTVTSVSAEAAGTDAEGIMKAYSTVAAVILDETGVIRDCVIDAVQTNLSFDAEGKVTADMEKEYPSKNQIGDDYGMKKASSIGKEWYEQADAFAQYCVGKTIDQVVATEMDENGKAVDADVVATVTVSVGDFIKAVDKAVQLSVPASDSSEAELKLAIGSSASSSRDASAEKAGRVQAYNTYVAAAVKADGTITACTIDASQAQVSFDTTGALSGEVPTEVLTKDELGENYGMKAASGIGKEWDEQAQGFGAYCVGKTVYEVVSLELADGKAVDADVLATATVGIDGWISLLTRFAE